MSGMSSRGVGVGAVQDRSARERSQSGLKHDEATDERPKTSLVEQDASIFVLTDQRIHSCEILQTLHDIDVAVVVLQTIGIFLLQIEQKIQEIRSLKGKDILNALENLEKQLLEQRHHAQQLFSSEHRRIVIPIDILIEHREPLVLSMKPFGISLKKLGFKDEQGEWVPQLTRTDSQHLLILAQKIIKQKQDIAANYEQVLEDTIVDLMNEELSSGAISPTDKVDRAVQHLSEQLRSRKSFRSMLKKIDIGVLQEGSRRLL